MCSRFEPAVKEDVILRWDINPGSNALGSAKWTTIYPKNDTLLITYDNEPIVRSWGLTPEWSKRPLINAKSEEALEKRTFTPLLEYRCVIPAASYYEWQGPKGSKIKTNIFGKSMLPIAGLYSEDQYVIFSFDPFTTNGPLDHLSLRKIDRWSSSPAMGLQGLSHCKEPPPRQVTTRKNSLGHLTQRLRRNVGEAYVLFS
jgi:putative SOS response-associated peptidase YedK